MLGRRAACSTETATRGGTAVNTCNSIPQGCDHKYEALETVGRMCRQARRGRCRIRRPLSVPGRAHAWVWGATRKQHTSWGRCMAEHQSTLCKEPQRNGHSHTQQNNPYRIKSLTRSYTVQGGGVRAEGNSRPWWNAFSPSRSSAHSSIGAKQTKKSRDVAAMQSRGPGKHDGVAAAV